MNREIQVPLKEQDIETLKAGDYVYLTGTIYTARDAAHKRMYDSMKKGEPLPIELKGNVLYYLGPTRPEKGRSSVLPDRPPVAAWTNIRRICWMQV